MQHSTRLRHSQPHTPQDHRHFKIHESGEFLRAVTHGIRAYLAEQPEDPELNRLSYHPSKPEIVEGAFSTTCEFLNNIEKQLS